MGFNISDMVHEHLEFSNTKDVYYHCTLGLAQALAREYVIEQWGEEEVERVLGLDEDEDGVDGIEKMYEIEEPIADEYEKQIKRFINNLRGEIYD